MADQKISQLAELTALAAADELLVVDKSDTSMASTGTDKRIKPPNLTASRRVEWDGAVGDGSTPDQTAIQATIDALNSAGGGVVELTPGKTYLCSSGLTWRSNIQLQGNGATIKLGGGSSALNLITGTGTVTSTTTLAAGPNEYDFTITLTTGGVAALGLTVGDWVYMEETSTTPPNFDTDSTGFGHFTLVMGIAGEVVTMADPLYRDFSSSATVRKVTTPLADAIWRNVTLDGSGNTGASKGMLVQWAVRCGCEGVSVNNFIGGSGMQWDKGARNNFRKVLLRNSGTSAQADLFWQRQTGGTWSNIDSFFAAGFGPEIHAGAALQGVNIRSVGAAHRAFKLHTFSAAQLTNVVAAHSVAGTGFSTTLKSKRNRVTNLAAFKNWDEGVWFDGDQNDSNIYLNVTARANDIHSGQADIALNDGTTHTPNRTPDRFNTIRGGFVLVKDLGQNNNVISEAPGLATVTAAGTITLPVGQPPVVQVTGNTNISTINGGQTGQRVTLQFTGTPTVNDGSNLKLAGNFVAAGTTNDYDTLTLVYDGSNWFEASRSTN